MSNTITGTSGNDTLYGSSGADVFQYSSGNGNDVIRNFSGEDIFQITSGNLDSYSITGGDLILNISGNSVTLKNMANHYVSIQAADGSITYNQYTTGTTQLDVIQTFVQTLANSSYSYSTAMLNEAIQASTNFNSIQDALDQFISDCQNAPSADIFLRDYCGIDLDNEDTGAITGWDAGGKTILTSESVVPESGTAISPSGTSFTRNGLTITFSSTLSSTQQIIVDDLYTWWIGNSLSLINRSYELSFLSGSPSYSTMDLNFYYEADGALAYVSSSTDWGSDLASEASLYVNTYYYGSIDSSDVNGTASYDGAGYLDRTIAHELTHAIQFAFIGDLPGFFAEGMAELTHGIDDERESSILYLAENSYALQSYTNDALNNFADLDATGYAAGYMFLRYIAKQGADIYSSSSSSSSGSTSTDSTNSTASITSSDIGLSFNGSLSPDTTNYVSIDSSSNISVTSSSNYNATILIDSSSSVASFSTDSSNSYDLEFNSGNIVKSWNVTLGAGNDTIEVGNVQSGVFVSGDGNDYFDIEDNLAGNITIVGGNGADRFHSDSESVSSPSNRHTIIVNDIDFDSGDVILTDAGVANLTKDFFGNARFYNYEDSTQAASSGVYSGTILNASNLVNELGMSFSMARMADTSSPSNSTAVLWANSSSATIDFSNSQTDAVLVFTDTNSKGDIVSLGGNYNDTIHASSDDYIYAGGGDDQIILATSNYNATIGYSDGDGNDIIQNFNSSDVFQIASGTSYSSVQSGNNMILTIGTGNVTLVGSSSSQNFNVQVISSASQLPSESLWGNNDSRESDLISLNSSDSYEDLLRIDEITSGFSDDGLIISANTDSSLSIAESDFNAFSLNGAIYTSDHS